MKKVGVYMRVGNKEQLEPTEQHQKDSMGKVTQEMPCTLMSPRKQIPTPEKLKFEGYDVVIRPKKKGVAIYEIECRHSQGGTPINT